MGLSSLPKEISRRLHLTSALKRVRFSAIKFAMSRKPFDPQDSLLIFSDPRGGSTWLMELLELVPGTASIFEPLHCTSGQMDESLKLGWRPYIPEEFQWEEARKGFEDVFSGKRLNPWACSKSRLNNFLFARQLIIKFVRGKSLLPWMTRNFDFQRPPVLLMRHPVPCSISQQRRFGTFQKPEAFKFDASQSTINNGFETPYRQHAEYLKTLRTGLEQGVATWCLHNLPVLEQMTSRKWLTVYYENLVCNPEQELKRIFDSIGFEVPHAASERARKPSQTVSTTDFEQAPEKQIEKWVARVSDDDKSAVQDVLDHFGVDVYSVHSPLPITSA